MEVPIINIGNSKGIILSKTILERYNFTEMAEINMKDKHLEIMPVKSTRRDWDEKFKQMHQKGDDRLMIEDVFVDEDLEEWK
jgi:antitoxin MazE